MENGPGTDADVTYELCFVQEFVRSLQKVENRLTKDVKTMCKLVQRLGSSCFFGLPEPCKISLKKHFRDIYRGLKFHMMFHSGHDLKELRDLGSLDFIGLTNSEIEELPNAFWAIDPASKIVEIISVLMETPEAPKGSKKHADDVIDVAKDFLSELPENNMFKPQVLVSVSCNGRWSVGSSVAGSYFITPLCLCRQIYDFKPCLKKAIISFKPVENVAANYNWSSSAVCGKDYKTRKAPCKNCKVIFKNLNGFLSTNDDSVQERSSLAACAEYGSVNSLLSDGGEVLTESEQNFLELKWKQCIIFFEQFGRVVDGIIKAYNSNDDEEQRNVFEQEKHILVIFNLKSESVTET